MKICRQTLQCRNYIPCCANAHAVSAARAEGGWLGPWTDLLKMKGGSETVSYTCQNPTKQESPGQSMQIAHICD